MDERDTRMMVMKAVESVFIPQVMIVLNGFILSLKEKIIYEHEYKKAVGFSVAQPPAILDVRAAQEHLADAIVIALKEPQLK